jgi:pyridoxal biosynthesis lyase PdxS
MGAITVRGDGKRVYQSIEEAEKHIHQLQAEISAMQNNQRERIATAIMANLVPMYHDHGPVEIGPIGWQKKRDGVASAALKYADALIARLAKERDDA